MDRFETKDVGESVVLEFEFGAQAASIASPSVECTVLWSAVGDTADIRTGACAPSGTVPTTVLQRVTGGADLTDYLFRATATGPNGDVLVVPKILPVRKRLGLE